MAAKLNPSKPIPPRPGGGSRHERYCQLRAEGKSGNDAYEEAGFKRNKGNASRLERQPHITARIKYLQDQAAKKTVTTVEDIAHQLDDDRTFARDNRAASAAVQATMGKAKVLGLIVDRHVLGMKRIDDMNEQELRALLGILEAQKPDDA